MMIKIMTTFSSSLLFRAGQDLRFTNWSALASFIHRYRNRLEVAVKDEHRSARMALSHLIDFMGSQ